MTTLGASSTIMGAICRVKSAACPVAFASNGTIRYCGGPGTCCGSRDFPSAGRSLAAPVAIMVAHPSRTKSLRFTRSSSRMRMPPYRSVIHKIHAAKTVCAAWAAFDGARGLGSGLIWVSDVLRLRLMRRLSHGRAVDAQVVERIFDVAGIHLRSQLHKTARSDDLIDNKFRLIGGQFHPLFFLDLIDDVIEDLIGKGEPHLVALRVEDATVRLETRRGDFDFVGQTAEERGIHQIFRLDIGGEDDQFLKGNGDALAGMEFEVVDAVFEGHDPAVEEGGGADQLTAKVVDDEAATQRLDMERRFVIVAEG